MSDSYANEQRVNHPSHYGGGDDVYETIKVLEAKMTPQAYAGYLEGCARKYLDRHLKKEGLVDVEKGLWFYDRLHKFLLKVGYGVVYGEACAPGSAATYVVPSGPIIGVRAVGGGGESPRECVNRQKSELVLLIRSLAGKKKYVDFYRAVAMRARIPREEAAAACIELGYGKNGKLMPRRRTRG